VLSKDLKMEDNNTKGYVFMASSLDGFVARQDHSLDWLMKYDTGNEDQGYDHFISKIDVLVMGSGSFKTVLGFGSWPYQIPVYVLSNKMKQEEIPAELQDKVIITNENPKSLMQFLYKKGYQNAYVDGGKVVHSFLKEGLIQEMTITQIPILIGDGKRMFGDLENDIDLKLLSSKVFEKCGFVQTYYAVVNNL